MWIAHMLLINQPMFDLPQVNFDVSMQLLYNFSFLPIWMAKFVKDWAAHKGNETYCAALLVNVWAYQFSCMMSYNISYI